MFRDGRTERKLGFYPRVPCGRIEIFDVQGEISFGHIQTKRGVKEFPIGSLLEAIPEGSIGHLIKDEWWRRDAHELPVVGRESVTQELRVLASTQEDVVLMAITLGNKKEVVDARGLGFVNRAYATLYTTMRQQRAARALAQVGRDNFAFVASSCSEERILETERVVERVEETLEGIPHFFIGVYWHVQASQSEAAGDQSEYKIERALDYALLAAEVGVRENKRSMRFARGTPQILMHLLRKEGAYGQLEKDYETLREIGVRNAFVENQRALACFSLGKIEQAVESSARAVELNPSRTLRANLALFTFAAGDRIRASELFGELGDFKGLSEVYTVARAMAMFAKFEKTSNEVDPKELAELLRVAALSPRDRRIGVGLNEVYLAIHKVNRVLAQATENEG